MKRIREITAGEENYRLESLASGPGFRAVMGRRDPVEPVPAGTIIAKVFRVTGYDPDCDGSLMARLEAVSADGEPTGWETTHHGLYPGSSWVLDCPDELDRLSEVSGDAR